MSNKIAKSRLNAFRNQSGLCYYCKSQMWLTDKKGFAKKHSLSLPAASRFQCTAEHLTARCDGGKGSRENIVAACIFCNTARHRRKIPPNPLKHRAHVKKRLKQGKWHPSWLQHLVYQSV